MARFRNTKTGVTFSVDDAKADRFTVGYERIDGDPPKRRGRKATPTPPDPES